jgi:hypothetical protein
MDESDEMFFVSLMETNDLWDLRHYGDCLRLSGSGYRMSVFKSNTPDSVMVRIVNHSTGVRLDQILNTGSEVVYVGSLKMFFNEVYNYLKEKDPSALDLWIKQLRSSMDAFETIGRNSKILVK